MQLASEIFDSGKQARRGTAYGFADHNKLSVSHGIEQVPAGTFRERFHVERCLFGMAVREDQELWLQADHFLETDAWPVLQGLDDRRRAGMGQRVGDEGVFTDGDERISTDDE